MEKSEKWTKAVFICLAVLLVIIGMIQATKGNAENAAGSDALTEYWVGDSEAAQELIDYVNAVTDEESENFIPEEDRIAVFDVDGTLACETYYTYFDTMMFIDFCRTRLDGSEYLSEKDKEELKTVSDAVQKLSAEIIKKLAESSDSAFSVLRENK